MYGPIHSFVDYIIEQQPIFKDNGKFVIKEHLKYKEAPTDVKCNQFVIRQTKKAAPKPSFESKCSREYETTFYLRLIAKFEKYESTNLEYLLNTVNVKGMPHDVVIKGFYDDSVLIFKEEYGKDLTNKDIHLVMIDFEYCSNVSFSHGQIEC